MEARYKIKMITNVAYQIHMYLGRPMMSLRKKNNSENLAAKSTVKKRNIWLS
jgi:hypothetical protein